MTMGYNIECDAGSLYYRTCYVVDSSGNRNEIIGYQGNNPITKSATNASGSAWEPQLFVLNQDGTQYQPYAGGGMPLNHLTFTPATGADPQDLYYLQEVMPGSQSRKKQRTYVGGWWMPIFGLRKEPAPKSLSETESEIHEDTRTSTQATPLDAVSGMSIIKTGIVVSGILGAIAYGVRKL